MNLLYKGGVYAAHMARLMAVYGYSGMIFIPALAGNLTNSVLNDFYFKPTWSVINSISSNGWDSLGTH